LLYLFDLLKDFQFGIKKKPFVSITRDGKTTAPAKLSHFLVSKISIKLIGCTLDIYPLPL
jgi:hypothetical protein